MLENERTVGTACHCLVWEDDCPMKQWQNVVRVAINNPEESLWNECDEAVVDYVEDEMKDQCRI